MGDEYNENAGRRYRAALACGKHERETGGVICMMQRLRMNPK